MLSPDQRTLRARIDAIPAETARLAKLADEAEAAPPLWDGYPDARDEPGFEQDTRSGEEQAQAYGESLHQDDDDRADPVVVPPPAS